MARSPEQPDAPVPRSPPATARVELIALPGLPEFEPGDDLAAAIIAGVHAAGIALQDGDVVVIAQKIVSKCEGTYVSLDDVAPSPRAHEIAARLGRDARLVEVILQEASEVLRAEKGVMVVANRHGHVMANAGVDASNLPIAPTATSDAQRVLKLPVDPDRSAQQVREALQKAFKINRIGVVINDSWGRAWRNGTIGHAVGVAGIPALWDRRGEPDMYGRTLKITQIGLADEIAAAASLVMGAAGERQPVVIVRGLALPDGDGCSTDLVRDRSRDLFR
jgi:coenzyme F420-0:L-glutamate ligase / coenzyme F420-1:gamma-L-glutamate ligase